MIDDLPVTPPQSERRAPIPPPELVAAFLPAVVFLPLNGNHAPSGDVGVTVATAMAGQPIAVSARNVPLLAQPEQQQVSGVTPRRIVVAVEGRDHRMADRVAGLLNPTAVTLALVHVTWVPGLIPSPIGEAGIDNPAPTDLLAYDGASEALVNIAQALRDAGFEVSTHLRQGRHPDNELRAFAEHVAPLMIIVGLHRHGEGIGTRLVHDTGRPVLFVDARSESP